MAVDLPRAEDYVHRSSRLLERHRLAVLLHGADRAPVLAALRAYQNADGGFGHALEPDVRCPDSQPAATLHALDVLAELGAADEPMVRRAVDWCAAVAEPDGGIATVLPSAAAHPRAPWMEPAPGSGFLTYAIAARLWQLGVAHPWLEDATAWCWRSLEGATPVGGYTVKFALDFLDAVPDPRRAADAVERLRPALRPDGTLPVEGGVEGEHLTPLDLSPRPGAPSRGLFDADRVERDLDRVEAGQLGDGGWEFEFGHWSEGQAVEWRGISTVHALATLAAHGRVVAAARP